MILGTREIMSSIDEMTIDKFKIPGLILMEHAAIEVVKVIDQLQVRRPVVVVCGTGNNGGDGFAVARLCHQLTYDVKVILIGEEDKMTKDAKAMFEMIKVRGIEIFRCQKAEQVEALFLNNNEPTIVDALFGVGCTRDLSHVYEAAVRYMNRTSNQIISIDLPSGIHCDSGRVLGVAVRASITVTFTIPKVGLYLKPGRQYAGIIMVVPIGVPQAVLESFTFNQELIDLNVMGLLPKRKKDSHKYDYGKILVIGGSRNMPGAALLTSLSAYRSGVGLVEVLTHENGHHAILASVPEAIVHTYDKDLDELDLILDSLDKYNCIVIGPGLGQTEMSLALLKKVINQVEVPLVIDADGLNILANIGDVSFKDQQRVILTPHLGELSRLSGNTMEEIKSNLFEVVSTTSKKYNAVIVAKSDGTIVVDQTGQMCVNGLGNPGMATAGSGDVLSGVIGAFVAQGLGDLEAASLGVGLHSLAGDLSAEFIGETSLMAGDIIGAIGKIMNMQEETEV